MFKERKAILSFLLLPLFVAGAQGGGFQSLHAGMRQEAVHCFERHFFAERNRLDALSNFVTESLTAINDSQMQEMVKGHFTRFQLLKNSQWVHPKLASVNDQLMANATIKGVQNMVTQMTSCVTHNPYLCNVINKMKTEDYVVVQNKMKESSILPDVLAYALTLENLTLAIKSDITILEAMDEVWASVTDSYFLPSKLSLFEIAKYYGLKGLHQFKKITHNPEKLDPDFIRYCLPINVLEATLTDKVCGFKRNASVGFLLAKSKPGGEADPIKGSGPATVQPINANSAVIRFFPPFPKDYADLYICWNLAFVSTFPNFPYFMAKLLIPSVHDYANDPGAFMQARVYALYCHVHRELFERLGLYQFGPQEKDWFDERFSQAFGEINYRVNANAYKELFKS